MLAFSSALIRRIVPNLVLTQSKPEGVRSWITSGSFRPDWEGEDNSFWLRDVSLSEFAPYLCFDYQRFALASWESFSVSKLEVPQTNTLGWPLLKLYYSAFFAAHAILRACGKSISRIESSQVENLAQIFQFYNVGYQPTSGDYILSIVPSTDRKIDIYFERVEKKGKSDGVHDAFWKYFFTFLGELSGEVAANNEPEANDVIATIAQIRNLLSGGGKNAGNGLSNIRNRINYQHGFEVWFPVRKTHSGLREFRSMKPKPAETIRLDVDVRRQELGAFIAASQFLVAVNCDVADNLAKIESSPMKFGGQWRRIRDHFDCDQ